MTGAEGFVVRVGYDTRGYGMYVVDADEKRAAHMHPLNRQKVQVFEEREEAVALLEQVAEWDFIAEDVGAVRTLRDAVDDYERLAPGGGA